MKSVHPSAFYLSDLPLCLHIFFFSLPALVCPPPLPPPPPPPPLVFRHSAARWFCPTFTHLPTDVMDFSFFFLLPPWPKSKWWRLANQLARFPVRGMHLAQLLKWSGCGQHFKWTSTPVCQSNFFLLFYFGTVVYVTPNETTKYIFFIVFLNLSFKVQCVEFGQIYDSYIGKSLIYCP